MVWGHVKSCLRYFGENIQLFLNSWMMKKMRRHWLLCSMGLWIELFFVWFCFCSVIHLLWLTDGGVSCLLTLRDVRLLGKVRAKFPLTIKENIVINKLDHHTHGICSTRTRTWLLPRKTCIHDLYTRSSWKSICLILWNATYNFPSFPSKLILETYLTSINVFSIIHLHMQYVEFTESAILRKWLI